MLVCEMYSTRSLLQVIFMHIEWQDQLRLYSGMIVFVHLRASRDAMGTFHDHVPVAIPK